MIECIQQIRWQVMRWVVFVSLFMRSRCPEFCCYNIGLLGWVSKEWDTFAELTDNKTIEPFIVGHMYLLGNHLSSMPKHMQTSLPFVSHFFRLCCAVSCGKYSRWLIFRTSRLQQNLIHCGYIICHNGDIPSEHFANIPQEIRPFVSHAVYEHIARKRVNNEVSQIFVIKFILFTSIVFALKFIFHEMVFELRHWMMPLALANMQLH